MCGICGIVDFDKPTDRDVIARMTATLRHRGPDDEGFAILPHAGLGIRRLSVIDPAGSRQPLANGDRSVSMIFNGEIYNYAALREALLKQGYPFLTSGDGETIVHLYEEHGLDFVPRLDGMFAIAIWDARRERLVLARDRLGIKPLYYRIDGRRLLFGSEIKAILTAGDGAPEPDMTAVAACMNYSSAPGTQTCFRGIRKLAPGQVAVFDRSGFNTRPYWDVRFDRKRTWETRELIETLDGHLREAVRRQMVSDVPLGVFLSGGVDSSLVAALMAEQSAKPVPAFTIGFGKEGGYLDETAYARTVARRYGMEHHELVVDSHDLVRDFEQVVWHLDEPCSDPAAFLTLALCRFARPRVTVALSGLGADEIFCGYRRYMGIAWRSRYLRLPAFVRRSIIGPMVDMLPEGRISQFADLGRLAKKFVRSVGGDVKEAWSRTISYLPDYDGPMFEGAMESVRRDTYTSEFFEELWAHAEGIPDPVDRVTYVDIKMYLVDQLLMQQDKMSMAFSLEARVPYLDHRLVELTATIPAGMKLLGGEPKALLKKVAEKYVPLECIYRAKKGFGAPVEAWLRGPLRERVQDSLTPKRVRERGIFNVEFIEWLKRGFYEGRRDFSIQLYEAFLLEAWMRLFMDGEGPPAAEAEACAR
jgi:asparagine synthase (glutamine-hydrolysing)